MPYFYSMRVAVIALLSFTASACEGNPVDPTAVAGSYEVETLTITHGATHNALLHGTELEIDLNQDGTTSGYFYVPSDGAGPGVDVDLTGTWNLQGEWVTLDHPADNILRYFRFHVEPGALDGSHTFPDGRLIRIKLRRR